MFLLLPHFRILLPLILTSTLSFALCVAMAVFLMREQARSTEALTGNFATYRTTSRLETTVQDLTALLRSRVELVMPLHDRIRVHLGELHNSANTPTERELLSRIEASFERYLTLWTTLRSQKGPLHDQTRLDVVRMVETETLPLCQELRDFNGHEIDAAELGHRNTLRTLAWGLAGIGALAALAGLLLGYGTARGLTQSIRRLQIGIRDAAGKLTPQSPTIELTEVGNLNRLHDQVQALIVQIEHVMRTLHQREREVLRAEQLAAVGQLAAGMAHELRNPLMSLKMLIQSGREEEAGGGLSSEDLDVMEREIRQMERSVQSFLDFARPPKLNKAPTDLARVLERTVDLIRTRAGKQKVKVTIETDGEPITLNSDAAQLQQVFLNLTLNALDAMPHGGQLNLIATTSGSQVEVAVTDNGPGIAPDVQARLFQPFFSTKPTGLGLGMVISRRIVEDHGGTLEARTHPGGGACFVVRLPMNEVRMAAPS